MRKTSVRKIKCAQTPNVQYQILTFSPDFYLSEKSANKQKNVKAFKENRLHVYAEKHILSSKPTFPS